MTRITPIPKGRRLGDLPGLLSELPKLSPAEAKSFGDDINRYRDETAGEKTRDPWGS